MARAYFACIVVLAAAPTGCGGPAAGGVPDSGAPGDTAPVPVDAAPVDTAPVDAAPVDTAPVDTAPVDTAPVDTGNGTIPTSDLHLWLRADRGVTAPGDQVSQWLDQSGSGRNASMPTAARQPVLVPNAIGGLPVVRFGGAQSMTLDVVVQPMTFSIFVVGKNSTADESFSMILGPAGSSPNNQLRWENGTDALFVGTGNDLPQVAVTIGDTRVYHELSAVYDGSMMTVYRNGDPVASRSFTTSGPWTLASVGSWYSTYFMQGDLAELIIYARPLSGAERMSVDSYLLGRYPIR